MRPPGPPCGCRTTNRRPHPGGREKPVERDSLSSGAHVRGLVRGRRRAGDGPEEPSFRSPSSRAAPVSKPCWLQGLDA